MKLIHRHKSCIGITLFQWGQRKVECWFCPPRFVIEEHSHPRENIELMCIYGRAIFYRRKTPGAEPDVAHVSWRTFGRTFTVKAGHSHWFDTSDRWLVFLNFEKWLVGKPTSAAVDFQPTG